MSGLEILVIDTVVSSILTGIVILICERRK